jgi:pimeloyl-ACP methyl ester carboxylesterase
MIAALALAATLVAGATPATGATKPAPATAARPEMQARPAAPPGPIHRVIALRGIRMYVDLEGAGPPLLLLHGGAGNGLQFEHQLPSFTKRYRCIVPDLCGQGRTSDRDGPLTYEAMAEDVVALMDSLRIPSADLMGWSDGGIIGLEIAIHHPTRLRHLVTFGANLTPDGLNPSDVAWNDTATVAAFGDGMREGWQKMAPDPSRYESVMAKIIALWHTQPHLTATDLAKIRTPALICAGEHDLVRREHTESIAKGIRGAELWIVPGASHSAMMERPDIVNAKVLEFLAK